MNNLLNNFPMILQAGISTRTNMFASTTYWEAGEMGFASDTNEVYIAPTQEGTPIPISKVRVLFDHYADVNNSGTSETDLYTDTLVAGQLANNGEKIEVIYAGIFTGAVSASQRLKVYFGGTAIFDSGALSIGVATDSWDLKVSVIRVSASVVRCSAALITNFATLSAFATYTEVTGLTLANTQIVKVTGTAAGVAGASNQITSKLGSVKWYAAV